MTYSDLVHVPLSEAAKVILEKLMSHGTYQVQSEYFLKHRRAGHAEGQAEALLSFLEARGLTVHDEARARILACTDMSVLNAWIRKAVSVASTDELFREEP
ncbi:hypothetical protein LZC95_04415 [Pendulispora brunnea]|uniref:Uncharacterized protein n=1 Tax=Pendulispora brunnea TaxID=2905690 RepID=A0ABZ2KFG9_9BACT